MPGNNRVAIEIYVDDQGSVHVREFADNTNEALGDVEKKSKTVTQNIQAGWKKVKAAWVEITAGVMAIREAWNMANLAGKAQQERIAFEALAQSYDTSGQAIINALKEASAKTISTMALVRSAGTAMMMGIDPETVSKLMAVARATSKMTGQTVAKAFGDISLAVGRQSRMILDNLGIIVDVEKANADYAASLKKTSTELTDAEKKQAFLNATLEGGEELMGRLGNQTNTQADRLQRMQARFENLRETIGGGFLRVLNFLDGTFTSVAAAALAVSGGIFKIAEGAGWLTDKLHLTSDAAGRWKIEAEAAFGAANELVDKANQSFKDMNASMDDSIAAQGKLRAEIDKAKTAVQEQAKAEQELDKQRKDIISDAKKQAAEQASITAEMYKEAGLGADQYFADEASKLVEKAAKWKKAGGDQLAIEEWLYDQVGKLSETAWSKGEAAAGQYLDVVQAQTGTLIEEFNAMQITAEEKIDAIAGKAMELDGTDIGLTVSFDGSAAMSGLDQLISRLRGLQQESATAGAGQGTSNSQENSIPNNETTRQWIDRIDKGGNTTINNFTNKLNRNDVNTILAAQQQQEDRS